MDTLQELVLDGIVCETCTKPVNKNGYGEPVICLNCIEEDEDEEI